MFCEKCGKENPDGVKFCESCGNAMENAGEPAGAQSPVESVIGGLKKEHKTIALGVVAVVVVVLLLAIFGAFKSGPVKVTEKYLTGMTKYNAQKMYDATEACPYLVDEDKDKSEIKEEIKESQEYLDDAKQEAKEEKIKVSFKNVKKKETYKKSEVKKIEKYLDEMYGYDVEEYPLQGVARVKATVVTKEDGDKDSSTRDVITIKVKGKWYVMQSLSKSTVDYILDDWED
ncbi:MAG: zinc ribbon domain-containing protein [Ruminococcaceae bacterium]|nr:zinc ribbon domain-containing protein [Oscillospiraceae bacterium]